MKLDINLSSIGANNSVSNLTINLWRINNMSEVQIVYLTVSQIYLIESLAEQEVERLQDEIENDNLDEKVLTPQFFSVTLMNQESNG